MTTINSDNENQELITKEKFLEDVYEAHLTQPNLQMDRYGFGAWSFSKMKQLSNCPLQFYLNYVLKLKVPEHIGGRRDSLSADVGTAGHRILELVMMGKKESEAFSLAKKEFVPSKLTEEQWVEKVVSMELSVSMFKDRMDSFTRRNPVKRVFTEVRAGVTKDWVSCGFFDKDVYYRGIIDLVLQLQDGVAVIIDHKTADGFTPTSTRNYDSQLNSYKPLFHYGVSNIKGSIAGINFIRAADVKMGEFHSEELVKTKLRKQLEWDMDGNVDKVTELGYFKHVCGSYCKWCPWETICKAKDKPLKKLELDTKHKIFPIKVV